MPDRQTFYRRWIWANGWAEAAGLGTTFALGVLVAPTLDRLSGPTAAIGGALAAIVLGVLLEGVIVGVAQERVLRSRLVHLPPHHWVMATAAGAGLAWSVGMVPSTIMALQPGDVDSGPGVEIVPAVQYGLAVLLGVVTGPILGLAQWVVLRRLVRGAIAWLRANAMAWAVGMPAIFLGMDWVPWGSAWYVVVPALYAVCGVTGLLVGSIHGRVIDRLARSFPVMPANTGTGLIDTT